MSVRDFYESFWADAPDEPEPWEWERRRALLLAEARPGERVLDLGCGAGALPHRAARGGRRPGRRGDRRGRGASGRARPASRCGCVEPDGTLPFGHGEFDLVWCSEVLEHIPDVAAALHEVRRVLKRDGRLLLTVPYHGRLQAAAIALTRFDAPLRPARPARALLHAHARWRARWTHAGFAPTASAGAADAGGARQPALAAGAATGREATTTSEIALQRARVEVVARLEGAQRALGVVEDVEPHAARAGARSPGSRARGRSPARARGRRPACCRRGLLDRRRGRTAGRPRADCARARSARSTRPRSSCALVERDRARRPARGPTRTGCSALQRPRRPRRRSRRRQRPPDRAAGRRTGSLGDRRAVASRSRSVAREATQPGAEQRRDARWPGRTTSSRSPSACRRRPRRTRSVASPTRSASQGRPRSRRRRPTVRTAAGQPRAGGEQRQARARPSRGRRASARRSRGRGGRCASSTR